ncbi:hypothetical protein BDQ17DRAFT_1371775 [Cyathus striatus]|nr:hypothetical protein BDQ17DRAFT_1380896 [Cyathus striatus]KAF8990546.1 hypothetical protein BDQ17DRAFT_1371775 [Cyathus striatus]
MLDKKPTSKPKSSSSSSSKDSSSDYQPRSNNSYYKTFHNYPGWMASHGLKHYNQDDVVEGKAILEGYKEMDRISWEEGQGSANKSENEGKK